MKTLFSVSSLVVFLSSSAWAQEQSFFDKYLPIATLFDSPVFFGIVVGSAMVLVLLAFAFLYYVKIMEKNVQNWGSDKSLETIVDLLDSKDEKESSNAFIYLRQQQDDKAIGLLIEKLKQQRLAGTINPQLIYLMEDLNVNAAIPILEQIARGKNRSAQLAEQALERIYENQTEETSAA
ncbi:MAG: hypothetical protein ACOX5R_14950 [bacterium]|jgi:hypothetical protein